MENKTYKKISHFNDILKRKNDLNVTLFYTNEQFDNDLKKWFSETKTKHSY